MEHKSRKSRRSKRASTPKSSSFVQPNLTSNTGRIFEIVRGATRDEPSTSIVSGTREELSDIAAISLAFDHDFYRQISGLTAETDKEIVHHYYMKGWKQGFDPAPWFSVEAYLGFHTDVRRANFEPFTHYVRVGLAEGRQLFRSITAGDRAAEAIIGLSIETDYYRSQVGDLGNMTAALHYILVGESQGLSPTPDFDPVQYKRLNADVRRSGILAYAHFMLYGRAEGRIGQIDRSPPRRLGNRSKVLFVGHSARVAGGERVLLETVEWYSKHTDYEVSVLLLSPGSLASAYERFAHTITIDGVDDIGFAQESGLFSASYDYIYANTAATAEFIRRCIVFRRLKTKHLIMHVHELSGVLSEFSESLHSIKDRISLFIAASSGVADALSSDFGIAASRITIRYSFIRITSETLWDVYSKRLRARVGLGIDDQAILVTGCGTVYPRKGPDTFLEVACRALTQRGGQNLHFLWIGDGEMLEGLRLRAEAMGISDRVRFIGFREDAAELIAAADIFFLASREDPFPLVCLEAAHFAVPTVCFEGGTGITEFIGTDAGVSIKGDRDIGAATHILVQLGNDRAKREQLGLRARDKVMHAHSSRKSLLEIFLALRKHCDIPPRVTVAVPNYNHVEFIEKRLWSILGQDYVDFELLLLDDCSSDGSVEILRRVALLDPRANLFENQVRAGGPYPQWQKAVSLATASVVWIAESDDYSSSQFLSTLLPYFDDDDVNIAYCRTEIVNEEGAVVDGALDEYFKRLGEEGVLSERISEGYTEVVKNLGVICTIVNVSGALMRASSIRGALERVCDYEICGDWFVYLSAASRGRIAYSGVAMNYFRRHTASVIHKSEGSDAYFRERFEILEHAIQSFVLDQRWLRRAVTDIEVEWQRFRGSEEQKEFESLVPVRRIFAASSESRHRLDIGLYVHGFLFSMGGIERLATDLANEWVKQGHRVTIFCRRWSSMQPRYSLSNEVQVVPCFDETERDGGRLGLQRELAGSRIDVFIPMLSEALFEPVIDAAVRLDIPVIASEHNDPWRIEKLWWQRSARLATFAKADAIHLILDGFKRSLPKQLSKKAVVIPNGIRMKDRSPSLYRAGLYRRIISAGRLVEQKRFDRLIKAFWSLGEVREGWNLEIFGDGVLRTEMSELVRNLGLGDVVSIHSPTENLDRELLRSEIFVLPSEFEAFGLVVLEALAAGLPCVAYEDCNGPNELVRDGVNGLLVEPDQDGSNLAVALRRLIESDTLRSGLAARASECIYEYNIQDICLRWEEVIRNVVVSHRSA